MKTLLKIKKMIYNKSVLNCTQTLEISWEVHIMSMKELLSAFNSISTSLKNEIEDNDIRKKWLAEQLSLSRTTLNKYLDNPETMSLEMLISLKRLIDSKKNTTKY